MVLVMFTVSSKTAWQPWAHSLTKIVNTTLVSVLCACQSTMDFPLVAAIIMRALQIAI